MNSLAALAYASSVVLLFLKFVFAASLQGATRIRTRSFQYAEDAAEWHGEVRAVESDLVVRAQRLLRNDGESQPFYLAIGAIYVAVGAAPAAAPYYFGAYTLSRLAHAWFFLRPRQPHRSRAFALGLIVLCALAVHTLVQCVAPFLR